MCPRLVRAATLDDATAVIGVLRESITKLCVADHHNDSETLNQWLCDKTIDAFNGWLASSDTFVVVGEMNLSVCGVGSVHSGGEIRLCYVQPGKERLGVGGSMLRALEARARDWGLPRSRLMSAFHARSFYEHHRYVSTGPPTSGFGISRCHPYSKDL